MHVGSVSIIRKGLGILELLKQHDIQVALVRLSASEEQLVEHGNVEALRSPSTMALVTKGGKAIDELTQLEPGWDGYGGIAVKPRVAGHALKFLRAIGPHTELMPDIVPMPDGGLQLEWFFGDYEVEVEISPDCDTHFFFECKRDGRSEEQELGKIIDPGFLATYFKEIRR